VVAISERLQVGLKPVRPLPARFVIVGAALLCFGGFALLVALLLGYGGYHHLSTLQRTADYTLIGLVAASLAIALDQEIVPGSKRVLPTVFVILSSFALLSLVTMILFPRVGMNDFVAHGIPCLRLGLICATLSGIALSYFVSNGYATSRVRTGAVVGAFAGLTGVAALALHCPILNGLHILVWHIGAYVVAGTIGAAIGRWYATR
jgi:hypothetical protein